MEHMRFTRSLDLHIRYQSYYTFIHNSFFALALDMLGIVDVSVEDVSMAFALAWKFRCAVISATSSAVRSTFEPSKAPARIDPKLADPGSPNVAAPEFAVLKKAGISTLV
jgi:hypothetical protein